MDYISLKYKTVKTQKIHSCFSCLRRFPKETRMIYWTGIYDGDFNSGYTCLTCEEIISVNVKLKAVRCGVVEYGYVNEMISASITPEMVLDGFKKQLIDG